LSDKKVYRTVVGIVQFDPREAEAAGQDIVKVRITEVGFREQAVAVDLTLWPSHASVKLAKGDVIIAEGPYNQKKVKNDDGQERTFHNLSVTRIAVLGSAFEGTKAEVENAVVEEEDAVTDEIPF